MPATRRKRHSEERWALLPESIIRCQGNNPNGKQCGFEAEPGSVVCGRHGGNAPQVRRRAAERLIMHGDEAAQLLINFMRNPKVPYGVRAKVAQDLLDRVGLAAVQLLKIMPTEEDPIARFFEGIDPAHVVVNPTHQPPTHPAIESHPANGYEPPPPAVPHDDRETIFDAEIVSESEYEGVSGDDSPARIRQMIQDHVFDSQPAARS